MILIGGIMRGHPLITKPCSKEDGCGTLLSVLKDSDSLILCGTLLKPQRFKNEIITDGTLERVIWNEPIELFDGDGDGKNLLGAGKLEKEKGRIKFIIKLISEKHRHAINHAISKLGFNAFDRIYPILPAMKIKKQNQICSICDNPIGSSDCCHVPGKEYLRTVCRTKILSAEIPYLVWSGVREFNNSF
jgi:hypothetical protein